MAHMYVERQDSKSENVRFVRFDIIKAQSIVSNILGLFRPSIGVTYHSLDPIHQASRLRLAISLSEDELYESAMGRDIKHVARGEEN